MLTRDHCEDLRTSLETAIHFTTPTTKVVYGMSAQISSHRTSSRNLRTTTGPSTKNVTQLADFVAAYTHIYQEEMVVWHVAETQLLSVVGEVETSGLSQNCLVREHRRSLPMIIRRAWNRPPCDSQ